MISRLAHLAIALSLLAITTARAQKPPPPFHFTDVTAEVVDNNPPGTGIVFDYALVDINDDNQLDIVTNNHHRSKASPIWLGTPDGKFAFWQNMPEEWLPIAGFHLGELDLDGDGKTDLICTGNEGGVIINLNRTAKGAREPSFEPVAIHSSSHLVSFIDLDADGALETLLRPGLIYGDLKEEPIAEGLFHGNVAIADFDADGLPDLFTAGEYSRRAHWNGPRRLFRNKAGKLEPTGAKTQLVTGHIGGIPRAADFNNDGHFDLYVFGSTTPEEDISKRVPAPMRLYLGDGKLGFTDISEKAGIAASEQKIGYSQVYVADLDNDTHLDIVNQGNYGTVAWHNNGDGTFTELAKGASGDWASGSHLRLDDYDMDGRLDLVTGAVGPKWKDRATSIRVFRNTTDNGNGWLKLQLRQPGNNPMAIGATVTLFKPGTREALGTRFLYADTEGHHPRLHFGLAKHAEVDVEVLFPGAEKPVRFPKVASKHYLTLRPDGSAGAVTFGR